MNRLSMLVKFIVLVAIAGGGYWYWQNSHNEKKSEEESPQASGEKAGASKKGQSGPLPVQVVSVTKQTMPVIVEALGTVESEHSVPIRSQIPGVLNSINFREGEYVAQGQVLFKVDDRPMRAVVDQATAVLARDKALLEQALTQLKRLTPLVEKDYITKQEYDVALTQSKSLEATVAADNALIQAAKVQLSYSVISSPISGRTGSLSVKAGTLLTVATATTVPMVVVNSTKPIMVSLNVPQAKLNDIREALSKRALKVDVTPSGGGDVIASGTLAFIDNTVSLSTGTIVIKARFNNNKEELWPGQFVAGRIVIKEEPGVMTLPEEAIQPGQQGPFVFAFKEGKAQMVPITVSRQVGNQVVVSSGLTGDEQVIIKVPPTLSAGMAVKMQVPEEGKKPKDSKEDSPKAPEAKKGSDSSVKSK